MSKDKPNQDKCPECGANYFTEDYKTPYDIKEYYDIYQCDTEITQVTKEIKISPLCKANVKIAELESLVETIDAERAKLKAEKDELEKQAETLTFAVPKITQDYIKELERLVEIKQASANAMKEENTGLLACIKVKEAEVDRLKKMPS